MSELPKINKTYNCFDDGKVRESRRYVVTVKEMTPFNEIDDDTLSIWKEEVKNCHWLYKEETDFFIKTTNDQGEEEIFVRTLNDGWFSIGGFLYCGRLDVTGELTKSIS
tara:strand:- start:79 stop:405 length:327 start_codon:yes stop_codon:yes gene_type:complete